MELRKKLEVTTAWESSVHLQNILYLTNQAGNILEEPIQSEECTCVVLSQPSRQDGEEEVPACIIHVGQLTQLSGYTVFGVELCSGSRTVEVYSGEDYIATTRGTVTENREDEKLYHCTLQLPTDEGCTYQHLTLKLLSLQGRTAVAVTRLTLVVAEDYGGKAALSRMDAAVHVQSKPPDLQSLISSLPLPSNSPPFLQHLLSSLQQLSSTHTCTPVRGEEKTQSLDISQMVTAFRQLRPAPSNPASSKTDSHVDRQEQVEQSDERDSADVVMSEAMELVPTPSLSSLEAMMDQKIAELEKRLKHYVDDKVAALLNQIETTLEQKVNSRKVTFTEQERETMTVTSNEDGSRGHNSTYSGLQLEEQLD